MLKEKNQEQFDLIKRVIRLLKKLNFEDIRVNENYSNNSSNSADHLTPIKKGYMPPLTGRKNEVVYYFEFIDGELVDLKENKNSLQKIIEIGRQSWDADFVLVTRYGNKNTVREWCDKFNLPVDQIWEV